MYIHLFKKNKDIASSSRHAESSCKFCRFSSGVQAAKGSCRPGTILFFLASVSKTLTKNGVIKFQKFNDQIMLLELF